jgi:hypothetical protein
MDKVVSAGKMAPTSPPSPHAALVEPPLFSSSHAALKFAFNFTHGSLKRPSINVLAGKGGGSGRGLAGLDGAAQAGMIRAELASLSSVRQRIIEARFAPQSAPCACRSPCCRGARDAVEWADAIAWLTEFVLVEGLTKTISHYRLRRAVVLRYFGARDSFPAIAAACGINRDTACDLNKRVTERFRPEERGALHALDGRLKKSGIVAS